MTRSYLIFVSTLLLVLLSQPAVSSDNWEKKAFTELSKTPNAVTVAEWNRLQDFEKRALYETRHIKRTDARLAWSVSQKTKSTIISVDSPEYYQRQKIIPSVNIPYNKFTESFVEKYSNKFKEMGIIILYCR